MYQPASDLAPQRHQTNIVSKQTVIIAIFAAFLKWDNILIGTRMQSKWHPIPCIVNYLSPGPIGLWSNVVHYSSGKTTWISHEHVKCSKNTCFHVITWSYVKLLLITWQHVKRHCETTWKTYTWKHVITSQMSTQRLFHTGWNDTETTLIQPVCAQWDTKCSKKDVFTCQIMWFFSWRRVGCNRSLRPAKWLLNVTGCYSCLSCLNLNDHRYYSDGSVSESICSAYLRIKSIINQVFSHHSRLTVQLKI